jgi:hypothetical protein
VATLPEEIPTGLVTGQFYFVNEDNIDADTDPSLTPVTGKVVFTAELDGKILRMPTKKAIIVPMTFDAVFDSQGNLIPDGGTGIGIELPSSTSSLFNPTNFTWKVTFELKDAATNFSINIPSFSFQIGTGDVKDLTELMPVDTQVGVLTVQGPQGNPGDMVPVAGPGTVTGAVALALSAFPSTRIWTMTGNVTLTLPTPDATRSGTITLVLKQDATGNRTMTWPAGIKWTDGIAQQPAVAANSTSVIHLLWTGTEWLGLLGGKSFA